MTIHIIFKKTFLFYTVASLILLTSVTADASASIIAEYNFTGGSDVSIDSESNSTASTMTKPALTNWGFSTSSHTAWARSVDTSASEAGAIAGGHYFGFSAEPVSGYEMDLAGLNFDTFNNSTDGGTANTSTVMSFFVRSSLDGFASNLGPTFTQAWNTNATQTVDLSGPAFQNIDTSTDFRLYMYDNGIDTMQNGGRYDNVSLSGSVVPLGVTATIFQEGSSPTAAYVQDAVYIRQSESTTNQNADPDRELIIGFTGDGQELRGLLEFDVSAIPTTDELDSASLVLRTNGNGQGGDITVNLYEYGYDIDETTATWDDPGAGDATDGGTFGDLLTSVTFNSTSEGDVEFADTDLFRSAIEDALATDGILRLLLAREDASGSGNRFARFDDETFGTIGNRPELIVAHSAPPLVPEPSTFALAAAALLGFALYRRRR